MRNLETLSIAALAVLFGGCSDSVDMSIPDPTVINGEVSGFVMTPDSLPAAGALIEFEAGMGSCGNFDERLDLYYRPAAENGAYRAEASATELIGSDEMDSSLCMRLRALSTESVPYNPSEWVEFRVPRMASDLYYGSFRKNLYLRP